VQQPEVFMPNPTAKSGIKKHRVCPPGVYL
jgi:hypothetical protein